MGKIKVFFIFYVLIFTNSYSIFNSFLDCRVATVTQSGNPQTQKYKGRFVIGTAAGQNLLYGYPDGIWSSYTTIKIDTDSVIAIFGDDNGIFIQDPTEDYDAFGNSTNICIWKINNIEITQQLTIVDNPRTGKNKDTIEIKYKIKNTRATNVSVGLRIMLDTQLGINDNSPMLVEGIGKITTEKEWNGVQVPDAWLTLNDYFNPQIKAEGNLKSALATVPDKLIIGQWNFLNANAWDYTVNPLYEITDTAAGMFWNPANFLPNEEKTYIMYYGIPDVSGAELGLTKTVDVELANYGEILSYNLIYFNTGDADISNLIIWDTLPWNTTFVDASSGYNMNNNTIYWNLGAITNTYTSYSVWFRAVINPVQGTFVTNSAAGSYTDAYWNDMEVRYSNTVRTDIYTATPTVTQTITQTHTITPTHSITPTLTPTPPPLILKLIGTYPNPANLKTNILFNLTRDADIFVTLFTVSGEEVKKISNHFNEGNNAIEWDLKNKSGQKVASGVFIFKIEAKTERNEYAKEYGKITVVK